MGRSAKGRGKEIKSWKESRIERKLVVRGGRTGAWVGRGWDFELKDGEGRYEEKGR